MEKQNIIIYENNGDISVDLLVKDKTFWMTNLQISQLFGKSKGTISEHIKNIYDEGEFEKGATVRKNQTVQKEGNREVKRELEYYSLEIILAVGYRVRSRQGTLFRIWATKKLKEYLENGFVLNEDKLKSGKTTEYFDKLQNKLKISILLLLKVWQSLR